jgi:hypothetical protein
MKSFCMDLSVVFPEVSGGSRSGILADLRGMSKCSDKNAETPHPVPLVDPLTRSGADDSRTPPTPRASDDKRGTDPLAGKSDAIRPPLAPDEAPQTGPLAGKSHAFWPPPEKAGRLAAESAEGAFQPIIKEIGGQPGPEPTRYGDWERKGRCIDF